VSALTERVHDVFSSSCIILIEIPFTNAKALELVTSEVAEENKMYIRDITIALLLNYLLSSLDRKCSSKLFLEITVLDWFYQRSIALLLSDIDSNYSNFASMFGMLHSINILLYHNSHTQAPSASMITLPNKGQNDQLLLSVLLFCKDERYVSLCELLISTIERYLSKIFSSYEDADTPSVSLPE
jgi:hypothetical protein